MTSLERRSSPRIRAYRPVRLRRPATPQVVETLTKDLGVGGMRCLSQSLFPVGMELNVEVVLSNGHEPVTLRSRSVWFRTIPHSEQFDVGLAFVDLSLENKRRLSAYIDLISRQYAPVHV